MRVNGSWRGSTERAAGSPRWASPMLPLREHSDCRRTDAVLRSAGPLVATPTSGSWIPPGAFLSAPHPTQPSNGPQTSLRSETASCSAPTGPVASAYLDQRPVASTAGIDVLLVQSPEQKAPVDWSADGRYILYTSQSPTTGIDLWALPLFGDRKPWAVAQTRYSDGSAVGGAELSPNSRWLAHQSNETGRDEIYVQAFPGRTGQVRVSAAGGSAPHWREDGRELFYVAPDRRLMSASTHRTVRRCGLESPRRSLPCRLRRKTLPATLLRRTANDSS